MPELLYMQIQIRIRITLNDMVTGGKITEEQKQQILSSYNPDMAKLDISGYIQNVQKQLTDIQGVLTATDAEGLHTSLEQLNTGVTALKAYTSQLASLSGNMAYLKGALAKLNTAVAKLSAGSESLASGMEAYTSGGNTLAEAMKEFDKEGIQKLGDLAGDDLENVLHNVKAVKKADESYQSFGGIKDGQKGKVKFIIETKEIK